MLPIWVTSATGHYVTEVERHLTTPVTYGKGVAIYSQQGVRMEIIIRALIYFTFNGACNGQCLCQDIVHVNPIIKTSKKHDCFKDYMYFLDIVLSNNIIHV